MGESSPGPEAVTRSHGQADLTIPPPPGQPGAAIPQPPGARPTSPPDGVVRHGPGVPVPAPGGAGTTAERIWRTSPPAAPRRRRRLIRALGPALAVLLLAAAAVVLLDRTHHAPFQVTGAVISQQTRNGCGVDVTGRIATNGSAGTISYQWVFRPDTQAPQPLTQSVIAGQRDVFVTVAMEGSGQGTASQQVTLQVLGPDARSVSAAVALRC